MKYLTVSVDNRVIAISIKQMPSTIPYEGDIPNAEEGYHLEYREGNIVVVSDVNPSEQRREAYRAEVDEMANTYVNYKADAKKARKDGNKALADKYDAIAEAIFDEIGEKRVAIRERYPDEVSE